MRKWVFTLTVGLAAAAASFSTAGLASVIASGDLDRQPAPAPEPLHVGRSRFARSAAARWLVATLMLIPMIVGACASGTRQPVASNGRLLHASDLPDMRLHSPAQLIPDAQTFAQALSDGDAVLFKEPAKAVPMLKQDGFVQAVAEDWNGPGTYTGSLAVEFGSPAKATAALDSMYQDLLQPCPNEPVCSIQHLFAVSGIPGSKGQAWTPYRKFGRTFTQYRVLFQVGSIVYGAAIGGNPENYDPGSISQTESFKTFRALYARVKNGIPSDLFAPTPMPS